MDFDIFDKKAQIYFKENFDDLLNKMSDEINSSDYVYIVTYSLPTGSTNRIFNNLRRLSIAKEIKVISNAPKGLKDDYRLKLNPINYCIRNFKSYFNFQNHSKMIITQSAVYIGSQNLVNNTSFELGSIYRDAEGIAVALEIFNKLIESSTELGETEVTNLQIDLAENKIDILNSHNTIMDMLIEKEEISKYKFVEIWNRDINIDLLKDEVRKLKESLTKTQEILNTNNYLVDTKFNNLLKQAILECNESHFLERYKKVDEFEDAPFDSQEEIEKRLFDDQNIIPDEIESYQKKQNEISNQVYNEIEVPNEKAYIDFWAFDRKVRELLVIIKSTIHKSK